MTSNTHPRDMRTWIADLEGANELIRIDKHDDATTEMGSLLYQSREKALLFENLPHSWRSLGQAPANVRHAALAFGTNEEALVPFCCRATWSVYQAYPAQRRAGERVKARARRI